MKDSAVEGLRGAEYEKARRLIDLPKRWVRSSRPLGELWASAKSLLPVSSRAKPAVSRILQHHRFRRGPGGKASVLVLGARMILDLSNFRDFGMWEEVNDVGLYEPGTTRALMAALRPGDTFVDVGANNGYYSVLAALRVGPVGRVFAFEPSPTAFTRLCRNVHRNGASRTVEAFPIALSSRPGRSRLTEPAYARGYGNDAWGRLSNDLTGAEVNVSTLDAALPPGTVVDVLKVDVEGHEPDVLRGAWKTLERSPGLRGAVEWNGDRSFWPVLRQRFSTFKIGEPGDLTPTERPPRLTGTNVWLAPRGELDR